MEEIFIQLAIILFTAFIVAYIIRSFNQPIIIGYILAGIIISPFILESGASTEIINIFSELGIAFLLFIVGLHLNPKVIKEVGSAALAIGFIQILLTFIISFVISFYLLGFNIVTSAYIGIALSFSSTIIIMKLLSDKRQLDSLYGKISIGVLIIQDLAAIAVLMFVSSLSSGSSFSSFAVQGFLSGSALLFFLFLIGFLVLPGITKTVAKSQELLFLFSICWCFVVAALFSYFGFSIEIGALVAGVVLSVSPYSTEISSKIRPLRDFFLIIFFIILGLNIEISSLSSVITDALILSFVALFFKPLILISLMAIFGYTKRTNFLVGTTLAQISEFSLIVLTLGMSLGHISQQVLATLTLTGLITITFSTYMIIYSNEFYNKVSRFLTFFERRKVRKQRKVKSSYQAILFGYNRIGFSILKSLKKMKKSYLVVDFNPDTIATLQKFRIPALYGDTYDPELLEELPLDKVELVVSTIPDFETNFLLIETVRLANPKAIVIARAHTIQDALDLYKKGASYVLTPHFLGGEFIANMIKKDKISTENYKKEKEKHIENLEEIAKRIQGAPEEEQR